MEFYKTTLKYNTRYSCYNSPYLYYINNDKLYKSNILTSQIIDTYDCSRIDLLDLVILNNILYRIYKDRIETQDTKVVLYTDSYKVYGTYLYIKSNEYIYILKDGLVQKIVLVQNIKDFCIQDEYIWIIDINGLVYKKYNILYTSTIILNNPILCINYNEINGRSKMEDHKSDIDNMSRIEYNKYLYLCYESHVDVYDIYTNSIVLKYRYNTKYYTFYNCSKVYLIDTRVLILEEYPKLILDKRVEKVYQNKDKDVLLMDDILIFNNASINGEMNSISNTKVDINNFNISNTSTFNNTNLINSLRVSFTIPNDISYTDFYKKYKQEILKKYSNLYMELYNLNNNLDNRKREHDRIKKEMDNMCIKYERRKRDILMRIDTVKGKYYRILERIRIDGSRILKLCTKLKDEIRNMKVDVEDKYLMILKVQRDLLTKKVQG